MIKIKKGQQKLTKSQEVYLKKFAQKQIEKYLSTEQKLSDKQIELCVRNAYKVAGLELPKKIRWFKSPEAFSKAVGASVGASVRASVGASVGDSVRASVRASVGASVRASVRDSVGASVGAWYDADDLSFYKLFHEALQRNKLVWLSKVAENVTGYGFYEKQCWLVRKPIILTRNSKGQLHGENEMAVKWADKTGYYFFNGVRTNEKVIKTPEKLTKKDWLNESNLETRRIIQERMPNFVKKIGGKSINKSTRGELLEVDLGSDPEKIAHYVKVKDSSTSREYFLRVPPTINEVDEAIAWTFGLEAKDYKPSKEA